jgi:molybdopterin/thiamine biosynthesis adenylyltransferase
MPPPSEFERYHRQMLLPGIGVAGQARISEAVVMVVGVGALGCVIADQMVRAGVGTVRLVDRDVVELTNLQRQTLFTEADAAAGTLKVDAAASRLRAVNSAIAIEPRAADVTSDNITKLAAGTTLLIDGTDNFETRYLLNDYAVKHGLPLVYGGALGTRAMAMICNATGQDSRGPCLRCVFPTPPKSGSQGTCDTVGVLGGAVAVAGGLQSSLAIRILCGDKVQSALIECDVWSAQTRTFVPVLDPGCPCCHAREFAYLESPRGSEAVRMCGTGTYQLWPLSSRDGPIDLGRVASGLPGSVRTPTLVRWRSETGEELMIFTDGRVLIRGAANDQRAKSLYARYIGI